MKKKDKAIAPISQKSILTTVDQEIAAAEAAGSEPVSSMVDIVARMTETEMFLQLKVSSFDLIISLDFIMQLLKFLHVPDEKPPESPPAAIKTVVPATGIVPTSGASQAEKCELQIKLEEKKKCNPYTVAGVVEETGKKTTIIIHVEQPDIILVEQMDDINCLALFFNVNT